ncbi:MAG: restriction endonuclease subunit S [Chloroflexi bacterium]|nr:restriction endonuclease subunit S [Chloroflexota bacterium]
MMQSVGATGRLPLQTVPVGADLGVCPGEKSGEHAGSPLPEAMDLPELPEGWVWTRLGEIAGLILGQSPPSSTYNENGIGLPFYQGKLEFGSIYPTPRKWCTAPKKVAKKGDVLISVRAPVGPTNICPDRSCIGRGLAAIRGLVGMDTLFMLYLMRAFEHELTGKGTGTTFDAITGDVLRDFVVPLPPLPEQHRIVEEIERRFSVADQMEKEVERGLKQAERLRQSILKRAFEGKLVPQDPTDEPAERLLERIKAEKASRGASRFVPVKVRNNVI